jgi:hypothetical protein
MKRSTRKPRNNDRTPTDNFLFWFSLLGMIGVLTAAVVLPLAAKYEEMGCGLFWCPPSTAN